VPSPSDIPMLKDCLKLV